MALASPLAKLFEKLIARLEAEVTDIRFIDLDWNQLDFENPPITYPCVLIDFPDTQFAQMQGYQDGTATVRLKLIYRSFTATSNITPDANREAALEFFELEQEIYEALQAWDADGQLINDLVRISTTTEKRDDGLRVRVMEFTCTFNDKSVTG